MSTKNLQLLYFYYHKLYLSQVFILCNGPKQFFKDKRWKGSIMAILWSLSRSIFIFYSFSKFVFTFWLWMGENNPQCPIQFVEKQANLWNCRTNFNLLFVLISKINLVFENYLFLSLPLNMYTSYFPKGLLIKEN